LVKPLSLPCTKPNLKNGCISWAWLAWPRRNQHAFLADCTCRQFSCISPMLPTCCFSLNCSFNLNEVGKMYYYSGCHTYKYQLRLCYLLLFKIMTLQMAGFTRSNFPPSVWEGNCNFAWGILCPLEEFIVFFLHVLVLSHLHWVSFFIYSSSISRLDMCRMSGTPPQTRDLS
jgi:hypothetical protein